MTLPVRKRYGIQENSKQEEPLGNDPALGVVMVFLNTSPNTEDRLQRLFLRVLMRETLPISNRVLVRLTCEREWL